MEIIVKNANSTTIKNDNTTVIVCGGLWFEQVFYKGINACNLLLGIIESNGLSNELLSSFNGSFSIVYMKQNSIIAVTDKVRSYPLYYKEDGSIITDRISEKFSAIDQIGKNEILSAGYTINDRTVFSQFKSIMPGEIIRIELNHNTVQINKRKYYNHTHSIDNSLDKGKIADAFKLASMAMIKRVVSSIGNKKILLPLSGGYDSRYLACMLKKCGVQNVVTYTYGSSTSYEVATSRKVAKSLGFEWNFVEYTDELWQEIIDNGIIDDFAKFSFMGDGTACLQEIPALYVLRKKYKPSEYCILPGYCGDLFGGSYLYPYEGKEFSSHILCEYLLRKHFNFYRLSVENKKRIYEELEKSIDIGICPYIYDNIASINENWFVNHKVAKYVVNAVRMFEYYGYEWRLPLWDNDLLNLWYQVPLKYRGIDVNLYRQLLFEMLFDEYGVVQKKPDSFSKKASHGIIKILKNNVKEINAVVHYRFDRDIIHRMDINNFSYVSKWLFDHLKNRKRVVYRNQNAFSLMARKVVEDIENMDKKNQEYH